MLKKTTLDPLDMSNYRPISNVTFMSKLLERCAHTQLYEYLQQHDLRPEQQSAYRCCHSTETAMLKVLSDAYSAADAGDVTLLTLAPLSTLLTTRYLLSDCSALSVFVVVHWTGCRRICLDVHSLFVTAVLPLVLLLCHVASHKGPS